MRTKKKIAAGVLACATVCAMVTFTACGDGETKNDSALSTDVKVTESLSSSELNAQIAKLENTEIKSFTATGNFTSGGESLVSLGVKGNLEDMKIDISATGSPEVTGTETSLTMHTYIRGLHAFTENSEGKYDYTDLSAEFSADGMTSVGADYIYGGGIVGSDGIFGNGGELLLRLANAKRRDRH